MSEQRIMTWEELDDWLNRICVRAAEVLEAPQLLEFKTKKDE